MSRRKKYRVTKFGYIILSVMVLFLLLGVYLVIWAIGKNKLDDTPKATATATVAGTDLLPSVTPESIIPGTTPDADATVAPVSPIVTNAPTETPAPPTPSPTPKPDGVPTPNATQLAQAVDGKLVNSGVVLRDAPNKNGNILGKYTSGTTLKVYEQTNDDYYYVKIVKENVYGYMAVKFVEKYSLLPGESASPTPVVPSGVVTGRVRSSIIAFRSAPAVETTNVLGQENQGTELYIHFKTDDFYYVTIVRSGKTGYMFADYVIADGSVPSGTPVP